VHGTDGFDAVAFVEYIREKRIVFLISCGVAIVLALAVSLALPKRYTAKSTILIDAPAGNDPRAATVMSPVYLESLKTYESLASSDTLFLRAVEHLHIDAAKGSALKVSRPASTTVVEISATLNDPRKAQALAQYIAEQTVELSRTIEARSAGDVIGAVRSQAQTALERFTSARQARDAFAASNPIEALGNELRDGFDFEYRLEHDLADARTDLAGYEAQANSGAEPLRGQIASTQARIKAIETQRRELAASLDKKGFELDARKNRRSTLEADEDAARTAYEDLRVRLNGTLAAPQFRAERLHIIDPGVVPRQSSFPNTQLNVIAAFLASLIGTFIYLALRFGYVRLQREQSERVYSLH
jgi:uncharacterized protein involved in exopolysaccharide biosynthesis